MRLDDHIKPVVAQTAALRTTKAGTVVTDQDDHGGEDLISCLRIPAIFYYKYITFLRNCQKNHNLKLDMRSNNNSDPLKINFELKELMQCLNPLETFLSK